MLFGHWPNHTLHPQRAAGECHCLVQAKSNGCKKHLCRSQDKQCLHWAEDRSNPRRKDGTVSADLGTEPTPSLLLHHINCLYQSDELSGRKKEREVRFIGTGRGFVVYSAVLAVGY